MTKKIEETDRYMSAFPLPVDLFRRFNVACIRSGRTRRVAGTEAIEQWTAVQERQWNKANQNMRPPEVK